MPRLTLTPGQNYRVKYSRYRNPFAGLQGVKESLPVALHEPKVFTGWQIHLRKNDVLTYLGSEFSSGSDPGLEELFKIVIGPETSIGTVGSFEPTRGPFDGIDPVYLQPLTEEISILEGNDYRLVTSAEFSADTKKPEGLEERYRRFGKDKPFVIYDPDGDEHGYLVFGDDPAQLAKSVVEDLDLS